MGYLFKAIKLTANIVHRGIAFDSLENNFNCNFLNPPPMKLKQRCILAAALLLLIPFVNFAQTINLGSAAGFVLFSSNGAVTNTGNSLLTGNVGSNGGSSTGFGNVNGVMHDGDGTSAQASADLLTAYNQLNAVTATFFPASLLGNGQTLNAGVYSIGSAATFNGNLILNAQGNSSAVFIFKIHGSFSSSAASKVKLINGALACNVYWKIEGMVSLASGTVMRGTVIANNAAINLSINDTLEGRALSTTGAVTTHGVWAYTPIGCGSATLTGPAAPALASAECYAIFSSSGAVSNSGVTHVTGDVGTNSGLATGFDTLLVTGTVHRIPDVSTAQCAADLHTLYTYLNGLPYNIQLLYPARFGNNLVLTPHTYLLNAATVLTDTVFLNAEGDSNAVFVIKINGALSTGTYACVKLVNGAQAKNVFWKIEGAVTINNYSVFCGTIVCNNGALSAINTGVTIYGRAFTTTGSITTSAITVIMPPGCTQGAATITTSPADYLACTGTSASFSVVAHGTGLSYQWRIGTNPLINGANITGANAAILTIVAATTADAANNYNVVVTGTTLPSVTSLNAALVIAEAPVITTQPTSATVCTGQIAGLIAAATGNNLIYQWRRGTINLTDTGNVQGVTTLALLINPYAAADSGNDYNMVVTGLCSPPAVTNNVTLTTCATTGIAKPGEGNTPVVLTVYPTPFGHTINLQLNEPLQTGPYQFNLYNLLGELLLQLPVNNQLSTIETGKLPAGMYVYRVTHYNKILQTGRLVSQQ